MYLRRADVRGECAESGGGVSEPGDWLMVLGEVMLARGAAEGAGLFTPVAPFEGDRDCHVSPK